MESDLMSAWDRECPPAGSLGKIKIKILGRLHGAVSRLLESIVIRGDESLGPLVALLAAQRGEIKSTSQIFNLSKKLGVYAAVLKSISPRGIEEELPWERYVSPQFSRAALIRGREKYHSSLAQAPLAS